MLTTRLKLNDLIYPLIFITAILVYYPVIISRQLVDIDFELIIAPLLQVDGISSYLDLFLGPKLFDVQPIRDLSLLLDIKLSALIDHQTFGTSNLLIWIGSCLVLERLLKELGLDKSLRLIVLLILVHPTVSWAIYWPAARKHLLSVLFIQLATLKGYQFSKGDLKQGLLTIVFYLLSILSQPINILWGAVYLVFLGRRSLSKNNLAHSILIAMTMALGLVSNYAYYKLLYPQFAGLAPQLSSFNFNFLLLSLSRGLTQIFLPYSFSQDYSYSSILNLFGLPLGILFFMFTWTKLKWSSCILILLILHPLILVGSRGGPILTNDTYLLSSLIAWGLTIAVLMNRLLIKSYWLWIPIVVLGIKAGIEIRHTTNPASFFRVSFEREPNCRNALSHAQELLVQNNVDDFMRVSGEALKNECLMIGHTSSALMNQAYAIRLMLSEGLKDEIVLETLLKLKAKTPTIKFLETILQEKLGLPYELSEFKKIEKFIDPRLMPVLKRIAKKHSVMTEKIFL